MNYRNEYEAAKLCVILDINGSTRFGLAAKITIMLRTFLLTIILILSATFCPAQKALDSLASDSDLANYDALFSELDNLLDSLTEPRSLAVFNLAIAQSYLNFDKQTASRETGKRLAFTPSVGYYHKSGFGLNLGSSFINDGTRFGPYQHSFTGSYDFQKKKQFTTGITYSRFITKKDLPFYTSPLQNELYGYFTYRHHWLKPSIGLSYGWGSREAFEEVQEKIKNIKAARRGYIRINTIEKVNDLNLVASVRHDFFFLRVLASDRIRFTPQLSFVSGSQRFGFNQTSNSFATLRKTGRSILYNSESVTFDDQFKFQPISLTAFLKTEYAKGKLYIQPQLMFDYYFPASEEKFSAIFSVNVGAWF